MADVRKKLATINSSRAAGRTSYATRKVLRPDVDGQELLPGISDDVTIGNIASKLDWDTCNVLQMVSRRWRQAIHNRSVYDAKVLSKSTEAFLVVLSHENQGPVKKFVLTLCSCRDNYFVRLPPIPSLDVYLKPPVRAHPTWVDCICLEGRVYLWIRKRGSKWVLLYVLDLAGDRKWAERKRAKYPACRHGIGVLDGKIYRFRGSSFCGVLNGKTLYTAFQERAFCVEDKRLPHTEICDPLQGAWSLVHPVLQTSAVASKVDLDHRIVSFSDWAEKKLAADPSNTFLTNERYEGSFSEWKEKQLHECSTISTVDNDSHMAAQVYYSHSDSFDNSLIKCEKLFFFGEKLLKYDEMGELYGNRVVQEYDATMNKWKYWKSFSAKFRSVEEDCTLFIKDYDDFATTNSSTWAIVGVHFDHDFKASVRYFLVRSPALVDDDNVEFVTWIDTGLQVGSSGFASGLDRKFAERNALRPICL